MLVVDAGALFEVVAATPGSGALVDRLADEPDRFAPHLIDVEVFSVTVDTTPPDDSTRRLLDRL